MFLNYSFFSQMKVTYRGTCRTVNKGNMEFIPESNKGHQVNFLPSISQVL